MNTVLTLPQFIALVIFFLFLVATIIMNGLMSEKEQSRKRWAAHFKDKPFNDPARVALARAGYPVY